MALAIVHLSTGRKVNYIYFIYNFKIALHFYEQE